MIFFKIVDKFRPQFELLAPLLPNRHLSSNRSRRLTEIYDAAEVKWVQNIERLNAGIIRYLLIAETPPWTATGTVRYFCNICYGSWVNRIWKAFFNFPKPADVDNSSDEPSHNSHQVRINRHRDQCPADCTPKMGIVSHIIEFILRHKITVANVGQGKDWSGNHHWSHHLEFFRTVWMQDATPSSSSLMKQTSSNYGNV
jgi:hypothetical protein